MDDQAHARVTDPQTSHDAARAVTPDLRALQSRVADYARRRGPDGFTDAEMSDAMEDSGSTLRSRRAELTERNIILNSGRKRRAGPSQRFRVIWVHRDHLPDAPPVREAVAGEADEARQLATSMFRTAHGLRVTGQPSVAEMMDRGARMIQRLSR